MKNNEYYNLHIKEASSNSKKYSHEEWTIFLHCFRLGLLCPEPNESNKQLDYITPPEKKIFLLYPAHEESGFQRAKKLFEEQIKKEKQQYIYNTVWVPIKFFSDENNTVNECEIKKTELLSVAITGHLDLRVLISVKPDSNEDLRDRQLSLFFEQLKSLNQTLIDILSLAKEPEYEEYDLHNQKIKINLWFLIADTLQVYNETELNASDVPGNQEASIQEKEKQYKIEWEGRGESYESYIHEAYNRELNQSLADNKDKISWNFHSIRWDELKKRAQETELINGQKHLESCSAEGQKTLIKVWNNCNNEAEEFNKRGKTINESFAEDTNTKANKYATKNSSWNKNFDQHTPQDRNETKNKSQYKKNYEPKEILEKFIKDYLSYDVIKLIKQVKDNCKKFCSQFDWFIDAKFIKCKRADFDIVPTIVQLKLQTSVQKVNKFYKQIALDINSPIEVPYFELIDNDELNESKRFNLSIQNARKLINNSRIIEAEENHQIDDMNQVIGLQNLYSDTITSIVKGNEIDADSILSIQYRHKKTLLIGAAGIGKSFYCNTILYQWACDKKKDAMKWVFLIKNEDIFAQNSHHSTKLNKLKEILYQKIGHENRVINKKKFFKLLTDEAKHMLIIIDSFDEMNNDCQGTVEQWLKLEFRFIVISRSMVAETSLFDNFLKIDGFSMESVGKFIDAYSKESQRKNAASEDPSCKANQLKEYIKNHPELSNLVRIPQFLMLTCHVLTNTSASIDLAPFFKDKPNYIIIKVYELSIKLTIGVKDLQKILAKLEFLANKYLKTQQYVFKLDEDDVKNLEEVTQMERPSLIHRRKIKDKDKDYEVCTFIHASFQEYLAARYIINNIVTSCELQDFIRINKYNTHIRQLLITAAEYWYGCYSEACTEEKKKLNNQFETLIYQIQHEPRDLYGLQHMYMLVDIAEGASWPDISIDISEIDETHQCFDWKYLLKQLGLYILDLVRRTIVEMDYVFNTEWCNCIRVIKKSKYLQENIFYAEARGIEDLLNIYAGTKIASYFVKEILYRMNVYPKNKENITSLLEQLKNKNIFEKKHAISCLRYCPAEYISEDVIKACETEIGLDYKYEIVPELIRLSKCFSFSLFEADKFINHWVTDCAKKITALGELYNMNSIEVKLIYRALDIFIMLRDHITKEKYKFLVDQLSILMEEKVGDIILPIAETLSFYNASKYAFVVLVEYLRSADGEISIDQAHKKYTRLILAINQHALTQDHLLRIKEPLVKLICQYPIKNLIEFYIKNYLSDINFDRDSEASNLDDLREIIKAIITINRPQNERSIFNLSLHYIYSWYASKSNLSYFEKIELFVKIIFGPLSDYHKVAFGKFKNLLIEPSRENKQNDFYGFRVDKRIGVISVIQNIIKVFNLDVFSGLDLFLLLAMSNDSDIFCRINFLMNLPEIFCHHMHKRYCLDACNGNIFITYKHNTPYFSLTDIDTYIYENNKKTEYKMIKTIFLESVMNFIPILNFSPLLNKLLLKVTLQYFKLVYEMFKSIMEIPRYEMHFFIEKFFPSTNNYGNKNIGTIRDAFEEWSSANSDKIKFYKIDIEDYTKFIDHYGNLFNYIFLKFFHNHYNAVLDQLYFFEQYTDSTDLIISYKKITRLSIHSSWIKNYPLVFNFNSLGSSNRKWRLLSWNKIINYELMDAFKYIIADHIDLFGSFLYRNIFAISSKTTCIYNNESMHNNIFYGKHKAINLSLNLIKDHVSYTSCFHWLIILNLDNILAQLIKENILNKFDCEKEINDAFQLAIQLGRISICELLISIGININQKLDVYNLTPLMLSVKYSNFRMIKLLINSGADINLSNEYNETALSYALKYMKYDVMDLLFNHSNLNVSQAKRDIYIHYLTKCYSVRINIPFDSIIIEFLAKYPIKIFSLSFSSIPFFITSHFLEVSILSNSIILFRRLLELGFNPSYFYRNNMNILMYAIDREAYSICEHLLEKTSIVDYINFRNKDSQYPLELANDKGNIQIINLLERHGALMHHDYKFELKSIIFTKPILLKWLCKTVNFFIIFSYIYPFLLKSFNLTLNDYRDLCLNRYSYFKRNFFGSMKNRVVNRGQGYVRNSVLGDGNCGYMALGITRQDATQLLLDNVVNISKLIRTPVRSALLEKEFYQYLSDQNIVNASHDQLLSNETLLTQYESDSAVQGAYIKYDVQDRRIDAGYSHPRVLQAIAHIQHIELHMWRLGEHNILIPHIVHEENYALYQPEHIESRVDLVFVNGNHFERLEITGYEDNIPLEGIYPLDSSWNLKVITNNISTFLTKKLSFFNKPNNPTQDNSSNTPPIKA